MIQWRIIENKLPPEICKAVLRVDQRESGSSHWQLLRSGNTRSIYRYTPERNGPSWLVKWGHNYGSRKTLKAIYDDTDANLEANAVRRALKMGIPTAPVRLVARTPYWKPPLHTLLVTEFLEGAGDLLSVLKEARMHGNSVRSITSNLADLLIRMHRAGVVHGDFSATNVLLGKNENLYVVDLLNMDDAGEDPLKIQRDLIRIVRDLQSAGVAKYSILYFLKRYIDGRDIPLRSQPSFVDGVLDKARAQRQKIVHRASRNAIRKSRTLKRFRHRGFRVFMVKGHSDASVRKTIDAAHDTRNQPPISHYRVPFYSKDSSPLLHAWKISRALQYAGLGGDEVIAFARRYGFRREDVLIYRWPREGRLLLDSLSDPARRRNALITAGRYLRAIHEIGINLNRLDMGSWRLSAGAEAGPILFTTQSGAFTFMQTDDLDTCFRWLFAWLPQAPGVGLGQRDLAVFLRAYGEGKIDRNLWLLIGRSSSLQGRDNPPLSQEDLNNK